MDYLYQIKNFIFLDGREYAEKIRNIPESYRKWWQIIYLWFHDNFEMIMIAGGCILLALLLISWLYDDNAGNIRTSKLLGGGAGNDNKSNTTPQASSNNTDGTKPVTNNNTAIKQGDKPIVPDITTANGGVKLVTATDNTVGPVKEPQQASKFVPKTESQIRSEEQIAAAKKKSELILAGKLAPDKTTTQKMRAKFLSSKAEKNISAAKESIKGMPGKAFSSVAGKSVAAWQSVKSGEALELGKEKFENALSNAGDFAKAHAKVGYALAFTTFMVIGFGLFFVPTLIMFVIGAITLMIFNKQKLKFFESV
jgi:hypothetical protein